MLVSLGGDVATTALADRWLAACGTPTTMRPHRKSQAPVAIESRRPSPRQDDRPAVAAGGVEVHHIIDPARLSSASPWRTVTVAAGSCVDANIASTAAIVLGEDALAWLDARGLAARLVRQRGEVELAGAWPEDAA